MPDNQLSPKILLIIDLQKGFVKTPELERLSDMIVELSRSDQFDYVVATRFVNRAKSPYVSILNWRKMMTSPDTDLVEGLKTDIVIDKTAYNCCNDEFDAALGCITLGSKPSEIYVCGLDTDCCVLASSIGLFEMGIRPIVLSNYCGSCGGEEQHQAGLRCLRRLIGKGNVR